MLKLTTIYVNSKIINFFYFLHFNFFYKRLILDNYYRYQNSTIICHHIKSIIKEKQKENNKKYERL